MPDWSWQKRAACRGEKLVLFFGPDGERQPERDVRERKAKAICAGCPVRNECLDYALSRPEKYGTWGGLNEDERASERRRRQRQSPHTRPMKAPASGTKPCNTCRKTQPVDEFGADHTTPDGLRKMCRGCTNESARRRRREAKEAAA